MRTEGKFKWERGETGKGEVQGGEAEWSEEGSRKGEEGRERKRGEEEKVAEGRRGAGEETRGKKSEGGRGGRCREAGR